MRRKIKGKMAAIILATAIAVSGFWVTDDLTGTTEARVVYAATANVKTVKSKQEYIFKNLPINRVIQNFFIDKKNNRIYGTMVQPGKGGKGKEDTLLIQFNIKGKTATAQSFLVIDNGGHGVSLAGYYKENELKLYVNSDNGKGVALVDAAVLNKTGKNNKNINYYDKKAKRWKNAKGQKIITEKLKDSGLRLKNANLCKLSKEGRQVTEFSKLCGKGEKFDRADFVRASDGTPYIYVRYTEKSTGACYLKIVRLASNFDKKVAVQKKKTSVTKYVKARSYNATMKSTIGINGINKLWQSEDVYQGPDGEKYFYLSTNNKLGDKLVIRQLPVNGMKGITYIIKGVTNGNKVKVEEIEGMHRDGEKIYFNHKVQYTNGKKIQTIESISIK